MEINKLAENQTKDVCKTALQNFAKEDKEYTVTPQEVKIVIGTKCLNKNFNANEPVSETNPDVDTTNTNPYYQVLKRDEPYMRQKRGTSERTSEVTFTQILGVQFDLMGKGLMAKKFLRKAIARFSKECNTDPRNIELVIFTPPHIETIEPVVVLFDNGNAENAFVRQLDWEKDIFIKDDQIQAEIMNQQEE